MSKLYRYRYILEIENEKYVIGDSGIQYGEPPRAVNTTLRTFNALYSLLERLENKEIGEGFEFYETLFRQKRAVKLARGFEQNKITESNFSKFTPIKVYTEMVSVANATLFDLVKSLPFKDFLSLLSDNNIIHS